MKAVSRHMPELAVTEATFALWQTLTQFPAGEVDAVLRCVQEWIVDAIDADNVIWIGASRVLRGMAAKKDPFLGWRLRARAPMHADPETYRRLHAHYYASDHYGKLTTTYYRRSHAEKLMHVGMTGRASLAGAGAFRAHRLRDGSFVDYAAFKRTEHYRLYYREPGIVDRMTIGFPVSAGAESFFLIDRFRRAAGARRRPFTARDAAIAGGAVCGLPMLHRQLVLSHGLLAGNKLLSPVERQILKGLIGGDTEKRIAASIGQKPTTLHKYVTALYARLGVGSRAALVAHWLGPWQPPSV
jgi:DNA-binding CsgD family transcriptional regulator